MSQHQRNILFLTGIGALFFLPFLGGVHLFDWDEINFAESAREMIETGDYFRVRINYEPFWEKPPFFFWLQVVSMKIFGINEFAARFPNALLGIISLIVLYSIGKKIVSEKFGMAWALIYLASFLPHLYYKSGIIDPVFNFFIFLSIYYLAKNIGETDLAKKRIEALLSGALIGMAIITKGPVGLLLVMLTFAFYLVIKKFKVKVDYLSIVIFAIASFMVSFLWFGYETITNSPWFLVEFFQYQVELLTQPVAGHEQPIYYHFVVVLLGCFPMSVLAIPMLSKLEKTKTPIDFVLWMKILFWVVMVLFTIVKTKIVHYSSMSYLPLSFLAAYYLLAVIENRRQITKPVKVALLVIGLVFGIILIATPLLFTHKDWLIPLIKNDDFAVASLNVDMGWQGWEFLLGFVYLIGVMIAYTYLNKNRITKFLYTISFSTGLTLLLYSIFIIPKIERFSQGPAITFYKSIANEDAYVTTIGFKSYAQYFYAKQKPGDDSDGIVALKNEYKRTLERKEDFDMNRLNAIVNDWLLKGETDKKAYFAVKINKRKEMQQYEDIVLLKSEGGFDFYVREKKILKSR